MRVVGIIIIMLLEYWQKHHMRMSVLAERDKLNLTSSELVKQTTNDY